MAVNLSPVGGVAGQFFDNNGDPLVGGKLYTYAAGTTTPQATYTSSSGATANSNPIILNAGGRVPSEIWLTDGLIYKFVLYSSTDQLIGSWDNIVGINSNFVNFVTSEEVQTATAGQTVFTLTTMQYQPGINNLVVYVDGVNQVEGGSYSFVETNSTTVTFTSGLHLGAVVKFVSAETVTTVGSNAAQVAYEPAGSGAVTTTVQAKLRETVSPEDFGAVGDGVTDDYGAFKLLEAAINSGTSIKRVVLTKKYALNLERMITDNDFTLILLTRGDITFTGGGTFFALPGSLGSGMSAGQFRFYEMIASRAATPVNNVTVDGLTFDGNNQFSQFPSSASVPNVWWTPVFFQGDASNKCDGIQIINNRSINGGGWTFRGQNCKNSSLINNYSEHSQGSGYDGGDNTVLIGNVSVNAHDAHFGVWNSNNVLATGNVGDGTDNGSGIDISGAVNVTVSNNVFKNCANQGIWVLQDPNTGNKPKNVTIVGNQLFKNRTFTPISEKGEIQVGPLDVTTDSRPAGTVDCDGLTISGNTIYAFNSANAITLSKYATNVLIEGNTFMDDAASAANRALTIWFSSNVIYRNNQDLIGRRKGTGSYPTALGNGPVWFDGVDITFNSASAVNSLAFAPVRKSYFKETTRRVNAGKNYQIDERFGYVEFGAEFNSANGSVDVVDIGFTTGGFQVADIELIVAVGGDRGVRRTRVVYQGYDVVTPTQIVAAADEYSGGTTPPTITFTASTGNVRISVGSNAVLEASVWMRVSGASGTVPNISPLI